MGGETSASDVDVIATHALAAGKAWSALAPRVRAHALLAAADALGQFGEELIGLATQETGLAKLRLTGELERTRLQLRLFADAIVDGAYLGVRIDEQDPDFVLGPRPDLRRYLVPVGPVLNFAASNFPFAFSVAGGDTASALAAGCAVVVKAHPGHRALSARTHAVVTSALERAGAPAEVLQLIVGRAAGVTMLKHPLIAAASFTGSLRGGRFLADIAAMRPKPIPFFGELGSVNPVFVTAEALAEGARDIAVGFLASVSGSAGQLCTKPGFLFVPAGHGFDQVVTAAAGEYEQHRLLNPDIAVGFGERRSSIFGTTGVSIVVHGSLRIGEDGNGWTTPTIVQVSSATLLAARETLLDEVFGPFAIIVEYTDADQLVELADELFAGNLTGTLIRGDAEAGPVLADLVDWLVAHSGRILFGGWPTGVAVTPAMQHGGPWPATTNDSSTSVGTAAMGRFLRPVVYQSAPAPLLPMPLRDDNPWGVPQARSVRGESRTWGSGAMA